MVLLIQLWNTKNNDRTQFEKNIHTGHWLFGSPNTSVSFGPRERREREENFSVQTVIQNISTLYIFSHF